MTHDARLAALARRGYTPRQAAFLELVLIHSGYFLRRHYAAFLAVVDGARTTEFLRALTQQRMVTTAVYTGHTRVYHLASVSAYDAIGQPNSRLRRPADPAVITQRLMTLDVLIAHRHLPCLGTEDDKIQFFVEAFGVSRDRLPGRVYRSENPAIPPTVRAFVDRVPILVAEHTTTFVFVLGWQPLGAFAAFLADYTPLLTEVPGARILFCSADDDAVHRARRMCERRFGASATDSGLPPERRAVLAFFRARQRFEFREFRSFTEAELDGLRHDLRAYDGPLYEEWYGRWQREGDRAEPPAAMRSRASRRVARVEFVPYRLEQRYPFVARPSQAA